MPNAYWLPTALPATVAERVRRRFLPALGRESVHQLDGVCRSFVVCLFERCAPLVVPGVEIGPTRGQVLDDLVLADAHGGMQGAGPARGIEVHVQAQPTTI